MLNISSYYQVILIILFGTPCLIAQNISFEDENFKLALIDVGVDADGDSEISVGEALSIDRLDLSYRNATEIRFSAADEIRFFTNLEYLDLFNHEIESIDLSSLSQLKELYFLFNKLIEIDLSGLSSLEILHVGNMGLSNLNVSGLINLTDFRLDFLKTESLVVDDLVNVRILDLNTVDIQEFDVSKFQRIAAAFISFSNLPLLEFSNLQELERLIISQTTAEGIIFSNLPSLNDVNLAVNLANELEVADLPSLSAFRLGLGEIPSMSIHDLPNLVLLNINNFESGVIDVYNLPAINKIDIWSNVLDGVNLYNIEKLDTLTLRVSQLNTVDLSDLKKLKWVNVTSNNLVELDVSSNQELEFLFCGDNELVNIIFDDNPNLEEIACRQNQLPKLELENLPSLDRLYARDNLISEISLSANLKSLELQENQLDHIDISVCPELTIFDGVENNFSSFDATANRFLNRVHLDRNNLETVFLKNGLNEIFSVRENPNLKYVCVDNEDFEQANDYLEFIGATDVTLSTYCSFWPGFQGQPVFSGDLGITFDPGVNCSLPAALNTFVKFNVDDGQSQGFFMLPFFLGYELPILSERLTVTPEVENYFFLPEKFDFELGVDPIPFEQNFCMAAENPTQDLSVQIIPTTTSVPGFSTTYKLIIHNLGSTSEDSEVSFRFDPEVLNFESSSWQPDIENEGELVWILDDLFPFQRYEFLLDFKLNSPMDDPPLNQDDELRLRANIFPIANDVNVFDNFFLLRDTVVNSFDPNDIRCLEGEHLSPDKVGEYLSYMIRFENLGTAPAQNVVVVDQIDTTRFDIASVRFSDSSHPMLWKVENGNDLVFFFEGIQLPFDDDNNDGYVTYQIKSLENLKLGDTLLNSAAIYFDFNFPIITNTERVVVSLDAIDNDNDGYLFDEDCDDFDASINPGAIEIPGNKVDEDCDGELGVSTSTNELFTDFEIYPTPASNIFYLKSDTEINSISLFNFAGHEVFRSSNLHAKNYQLDISEFPSGLYVIKCANKNEYVTKKVVLEN